MKKTAAILTIAAVIGAAGAGSAWAGRISERQANQHRRISHGIFSGSLTRQEARFLMKEQRRIRQARHRAWADGHLSRNERYRLEKYQDRASRNIYRLKHNRRNRW